MGVFLIMAAIFSESAGLSMGVLGKTIPPLPGRAEGGKDAPHPHGSVYAITESPAFVPTEPCPPATISTYCLSPTV